MTRELTWIGLLATLLIMVALGITTVREPDRQSEAVVDLRVEAVLAGMDIFAENCAICHGAGGEGMGATPPLNSEGVRAMDYADLFHTIERGRYNTVMAAYGTNEGGIFTNAQIDSLVALIQYANWDAVAARVAALGLTPPEPIVVELSDETLELVASLPDGNALSDGLQTFATECTACHGANGEGSTLGPALNSAELRARLTTDDLIRTISQGVPGTLMAGWQNALSSDTIANVAMLIQRWPELDTAGIEMPVVQAEPIDMSPEAIAYGERLFTLACTQCHGVGGNGTPMAPALNNQTFLSETPDAAIQQIIALGVPGTIMPAWGGRLTESNIAAITAYLRSLEATAPAIAAPSGEIGTGVGAGPPWLRD